MPLRVPPCISYASGKHRRRKPIYHHTNITFRPVWNRSQNIKHNQHGGEYPFCFHSAPPSVDGQPSQSTHLRVGSCLHHTRASSSESDSRCAAMISSISILFSFHLFFGGSGISPFPWVKSTPAAPSALDGAASWEVPPAAFSPIPRKGACIPSRRSISRPNTAQKPFCSPQGLCIRCTSP